MAPNVHKKRGNVIWHLNPLFTERPKMPSGAPVKNVVKPYAGGGMGIMRYEQMINFCLSSVYIDKCSQFFDPKIQNEENMKKQRQNSKHQKSIL